MARHRTTYHRKQVTEEEIEDDRTFLRWLEQLEDYAPTDPSLSVAALQEKEAAWLASREAARKARLELEQVRAKQAAAVREMIVTLRAFRRNFVVQYDKKKQGLMVQQVKLLRPWDERPPAPAPQPQPLALAA